MSLAPRASETKPPKFTLRKHTASITSVQFIHVPLKAQTTSHLIASTEPPPPPLILQPYLVSVDESGRLIVWDLGIRRPVLDFMAHSSQVMTVRQLGVRRGSAGEDAGFHVDWGYFGMVLTHGRDHAVKVWSFFDSEGAFSEAELVCEIPVNALNFSNVDVKGNFLMTPNTINTGAFDVYDVGFLKKGEEAVDETRLKRVLEGVDVYKCCVGEGICFDEFKVENEDAKGTSKFGIIMKLLWTTSEIVFIGYESGHVVQIRLELSSGTFTMLSISKAHFPDPVLSLVYDDTNNIVISTSIRSEVALHEVSSDRVTLIPLNKGFGKISDVSFINDAYIFASWTGLIEFYKFDRETLRLTYNGSFRKRRGMITGDLNIIGNLSNDQDVTTANKNVTKPNALSLYKGSAVEDVTKLKLSRRDLKTIEQDLLAVGYSDGTVLGFDYE